VIFFFYGGPKDAWTVGTKLPSSHQSGAPDFQNAVRIFENVCTAGSSEEACAYPPQDKWGGISWVLKMVSVPITC
jgi:hypothetical protein